MRECAQGCRCLLRPEQLGPLGGGAIDSCEPQDRGSRHTELRSSAKEGDSLSTDHLSSPPPLLFLEGKGFSEIPYVSKVLASNPLLFTLCDQYFSFKSFFHSKLATLSCSLMLKIIFLLFLWLLQVPPSGPWSPENWPMKAFYPRTIEKRHSSGIENTRSPGPQHMLVSGTWER